MSQEVENNMIQLLRVLFISTLILSTTACAGSLFGTGEVTRYFMIGANHFDPDRVSIPADTPFELVLSAHDNHDVVVSSPELGFSSLIIPATAPTPGGTRPEPGFHALQTRIQIRPLNPGTYRIQCESQNCIGAAQIVVGQRKTRRDRR
jgi:hypothetical protein